MVGSLLGLETLGLYAVLFLSAVIPISGISRIVNPVLFAGLLNARGKTAYEARLRLFSNAVPILAACYAFGILAFLQTVIPLVFGARYTLSDPVVILLALIAFIRIVRLEPATSLLLQQHKTGPLAFANVTVGFGLAVATILVVVYRNIEACLIGGLIGECVGLCAMFIAAREQFGSTARTYLAATAIMFVCIAGGCAVAIAAPHGPTRVVLLIFVLTTIAAGGVLFLRPKYLAAYKARPQADEALELPNAEIEKINAELPKTPGISLS
jgi:hypothetical protein